MLSTTKPPTPCDKSFCSRIFANEEPDKRFALSKPIRCDVQSCRRHYVQQFRLPGVSVLYAVPAPAERKDLNRR